MIDRNTIKKCKELINTKFKMDDLKFCLQNIGCNVNGRKDELQRRLNRALDCAKSQNSTVSIVLNRGNISLDVPNFSRGFYIEENKWKNKNISSTKSIVCSYPGDIVMKKLFFHKIISNISQWILPSVDDSCSTVYLNCELPDYISIDSLISNKNEISSNCLLLRSAKLSFFDDDNELKVDTYPVSMRMYINKTDYTNLLPREVFYSSADKKNRLNVPTILNEALLENSDIIRVLKSFTVELRYHKEINDYAKFAFALFTSTPISVKELCDEISKREKWDYSKFSEDLNKFMSKSSDIQLEFAKISLLSSTTRKRINIPFRGRYCNHLNPDDLEDYITINKNTEGWKCKICKALCTPDDIFIDEFYMKILEKHKTVEEIELYPDMTYKLFGQEEDKICQKPTAPKKSKIEEEIVIIDSDNEDEFENEDEKDIFTKIFSNKNETMKNEKTKITDSNFSKNEDEEDIFTKIFSNKNEKTKITDSNFSKTVEIPKKQIECIVINDSSDEEEPPEKRTKSNNKRILNNHIFQPKLFSNKYSTNIASESLSEIFSSDDSSKGDADDYNDLSVNLPNNEDSTITSNGMYEKNTCPVFNAFVKKIIADDPCTVTKMFFDSPNNKDLLPLNTTVLKDNLSIQDNTDLFHIPQIEEIKEYYEAKNKEWLRGLEKFMNNAEKNKGDISASS